MRRLPPIRWADVQPGTVVLDSHGTPRIVLSNEPRHANMRLVFVEGLAPVVLWTEHPAHPVELDATDAIGTLYAAGFTVTPDV